MASTRPGCAGDRGHAQRWSPSHGRARCHELWRPGVVGAALALERRAAERSQQYYPKYHDGDGLDPSWLYWRPGTCAAMVS